MGSSVQVNRSGGWLERNWKWFVPVGCLGSAVLFVGFAAAIVSLVFWVIRSTDVYDDALRRARADAAVIEALGQPIEPGFWVSGNINTSGPSGDADLMIPVAGPGGRATIYLVAHKRAGRWEFDLLEAELKGRSGRIDLLRGGPPGELPGARPGEPTPAPNPGDP